MNDTTTQSAPLTPLLSADDRSQLAALIAMNREMRNFDDAFLLERTLATLDAANARADAAYQRNSELIGQNGELKKHIAELQEAARWRDAKKEPPAEFVQVLFEEDAIGWPIRTGILYWGRWYPTAQRVPCNVLRWRPMPELPPLPEPPQEHL
jgi:hypothetical protein